MSNTSRILTAAGFIAMLAGVGCAGSNEAQRQALVHQQNSDVAAARGQFGVAGDEQRKAQDSHHEAVTKAINEGKPIPPQTKPGDVAPPDPNK